MPSVSATIVKPATPGAYLAEHLVRIMVESELLPAGSLQLVETALWTMSLAELVGGTPRRGQEHMEQVRELRRALGYDAEHVVNVALLAWPTATARSSSSRLPTCPCGTGPVP